MKAVSDTVSLIKQYQQSHSTGLLDEIAKKNTGLVKSIAAKFSHCGEPYDDLVQCGYIGLINAVNHFDVRKGTQFSTYATRMIDGEIRHHLRDTQLLKTPRWIRVLSSQVGRSVEQLTKKLGRLPRVSEIARDLNITEEGILEVLRARESQLVKSLNEVNAESKKTLALSLETIKSPEHRSFQLPIEDKIFLYQAMDTLSALEKKVIYFVFYKDLTETEVGQRLKLGQRKVSRVLGRALAKLRDILGKELW